MFLLVKHHTGDTNLAWLMAFLLLLAHFDTSCTPN